MGDQIYDGIAHIMEDQIWDTAAWETKSYGKPNPMGDQTIQETKSAHPETTGDHGKPRETTGDHGRTRETTGDDGRPRETTEDHGEPPGVTGDHGRPRETMGDHGRPREITGDR